MKKLLVLFVVLLGSLALAGTAFAQDWGCYTMPTFKMPPCKDKVLCKGAASGLVKLCGPCAPTIKWAGNWKTVLKCPAPVK